MLRLARPHHKGVWLRPFLRSVAAFVALACVAAPSHLAHSHAVIDSEPSLDRDPSDLATHAPPPAQWQQPSPLRRWRTESSKGWGGGHRYGGGSNSSVDSGGGGEGRKLLRSRTQQRRSSKSKARRGSSRGSGDCDEPVPWPPKSVYKLPPNNPDAVALCEMTCDEEVDSDDRHTSKCGCALNPVGSVVGSGLIAMRAYGGVNQQVSFCVSVQCTLCANDSVPLRSQTSVVWAAWSVRACPGLNAHNQRSANVCVRERMLVAFHSMNHHG